MRKTYKELISNLEENQIFVFGSNPVGINGNAARMTGGAALIANLNGWVIQNEILDNCVSITGKSYGITTVSYPGKRLSKTAKEIIQNISKFYDFALINPDKEFLVAYNGENPTFRSLNGYSAEEMAAFFSRHTIPSNVVFEENFSKLLHPINLNPLF